MSPDVFFPILFFTILFGVPVTIFVGANDLHTVEGRAKRRFQKRVAKDVARYVDLGLTLDDAKALANAEAAKASRELRAALEQADTEAQSAPRLRSIR